jgi:hypothetical protein
MNQSPKRTASERDCHKLEILCNVESNIYNSNKDYKLYAMNEAESNEATGSVGHAKLFE